MRSVSTIFSLALVAAATSGISTLAEARPLKGSRQIINQNESAAIYDSVAVSSKGYVFAATYLNEPEVAEVFNVQTGSKVVKKIDDPKPSDESVFTGAMSADGTTIAVAHGYYFGNDFYSELYMMDAASSKPGYEWKKVFDTGIIMDVAVSADGSTIAVSHFDLGPTLVVEVYDTRSGEAKTEYKFDAPYSAQGGSLSISADGSVVAVLYSVVLSNTVHINVFDDQGHSSPVNVTHFDISPVNGQAFALSADGKYLAAGQTSSLVVYKRDAATFTFKQAWSVDTPGFWVSEDCVAFSPDVDTPYLAVGFQSTESPSLQPRIAGWDLSTSSSSGATPLLNYTFPLEGGTYPNWPVGVTVSSKGDYVAFASWGTQLRSKGSEQVQLFAGRPSSPSEGPAFTAFTPGSMMAVGVAQVGSDVILAAGGKAVHATVLGNGGNLVAYDISP